MATLEIPSNVKCITSGQVPTTANLKDGEFAFGKVGGVAKLYGNVNGVIIDFTGDSGGDVSLPIVFSGASPGPGSGGTIIQGTYTGGYPAAAMIHLESPTYKTVLSPVQIVMFGESAGHTYKLELAPTDIGYTYDGTAYSILRQDNVKTLFGNKSIYGTGNIDLYRHDITIKVNKAGTQIAWICTIHISSSNTPIDSVSDFLNIFSSIGYAYPFMGFCKDDNGGYNAVINVEARTYGEISFAGNTPAISWSDTSFDITVEDTVTTV